MNKNKRRQIFKGTISELKQIARDNGMFELEICNEEDVKDTIKKCEGKHIQQIAYSSYHDALTQICFGCKKIRTSLKEEDLKEKEK